MSSSSSENTKLITTALGAAVAGAAIAVGAVKFMESNHNNKKKNATANANIDLGMDGRPIRRSFIYEDGTGMTGDSRRDTGSTLLFPHNHEEKMRRRVVARAAVEEDNMTPRRLVTVRVPATSANVGPGCK